MRGLLRICLPPAIQHHLLEIHPCISHHTVRRLLDAAKSLHARRARYRHRKGPGVLARACSTCRHVLSAIHSTLLTTTVFVPWQRIRTPAHSDAPHPSPAPASLQLTPSPVLSFTHSTTKEHTVSARSPFTPPHAYSGIPYPTHLSVWEIQETNVLTKRTSALRVIRVTLQKRRNRSAKSASLPFVVLRLRRVQTRTFRATRKSVAKTERMVVTAETEKMGATEKTGAMEEMGVMEKTDATARTRVCVYRTIMCCAT